MAGSVYEIKDNDIGSREGKYSIQRGATRELLQDFRGVLIDKLKIEANNCVKSTCPFKEEASYNKNLDSIICKKGDECSFLNKEYILDKVLAIVSKYITEDSEDWRGYDIGYTNRGMPYMVTAFGFWSCSMEGYRSDKASGGYHKMACGLGSSTEEAYDNLISRLRSEE